MSDTRGCKVSVNLFQPIEHRLTARGLNDITHLRWTHRPVTFVQVRDPSGSGSTRVQVVKSSESGISKRKFTPGDGASEDNQA